MFFEWGGSAGRSVRLSKYWPWLCLCRVAVINFTVPPPRAARASSSEATLKHPLITRSGLVRIYCFLFTKELRFFVYFVMLSQLFPRNNVRSLCAWLRLWNVTFKTLFEMIFIDEFNLIWWWSVHKNIKTYEVSPRQLTSAVVVFRIMRNTLDINLLKTVWFTVTT